MPPTDPASSYTPKWATSPFDNPTANTILRSADNIDFCGHSVILSEASSFFKVLFSLPQPPEGQVRPEASQPYRDARPVIPVTENSKTLDALLRVCYPVADPELTDLQMVRAVLEAASKYQVEQAMAVALRQLRSLSQKQPVRVWAVACILRLEGPARYAAERIPASKQNDRTSILEECSDEMNELSAGHYFRLLQYRRLQGEVPDDFRFLSPAPSDLQNDEQYAAPDVTDPPSQSQFGDLFPDLLCRSADGVEIRTHKIILAIASPVLRARLIEQPPPHPMLTSDDRGASAPHALQCLAFEENWRTMAALLHLAYPTSSPADVRIGDIAITRAVFVAARKYKMERVQKLIEDHLQTLLVSRSLAIYLIALQIDLHALARQAAKHLLKSSIDDMYVPEMEDAPASAYQHLLQYFVDAAAAVKESLKVLQKLTHTPKNCPEGYLEDLADSDYIPGLPSASCMCTWYNKRVNAIRKAMDKSPGAKPRKAELKIMLNEVVKSKGFCKACEPLARRVFDFSAKVESIMDVDGPVAQIELKI